MNKQKKLLNDAINEFQKEDFEEALKICDELKALGDTSLILFLMRGRILVKKGEFEEAKKEYEELLTFYPEDFNGWLELGNIYRKLAKIEETINCYEKAIKYRIEDERGYFAIVRIFEENNQFMKASKFLQMAISLAEKKSKSVMKLAHHLAQFRLEIGAFDRALEMLRYALEVSKRTQEVDIDEVAEIFIDYGDCLLKLDLKDEAYIALQNASMATSVKTLNRLAEVSTTYNLNVEAKEIIKKAISIEPDNYVLYDNLAALYIKDWLIEEAMEFMEKGKEKNPKGEMNENLLSTIYSKTGNIDESIKLTKKIIDSGDDKSRSSAAMTSLYSDTMTPQEVTDLHRELFKDFGKDARTKDSFKNDRTKNRQIKLGFVSADFGGRHPVSIFMNPILENLDKKKFHTTVYYVGAAFDADTDKAKLLVDAWKESKHLTQAQIAKNIEDDRIDILMDLSGHTGNNKLIFLANRLAPVQVTFLGYPGSTGVPNIDWILADNIVAPKKDEHLFSEKVARFDGTVFCYAPEENYPKPQWKKEDKNRKLTFGTFNNILKITPYSIKLWGAILRAIPDSQMIIKSPAFREEGAIKRYYKLFATEGVSSDRLIFRDATILEEMMVEYLDIDIALDPLPYNGGTTTLQAMWMRCPVITKEGGLFVSRMGASFLTAANLSDWIAKSDEEYIQIAIEKSKDREALWKLKEELRDRLLKNDAWNIKKYTKKFEQLLQQMWEDECKSK